MRPDRGDYVCGRYISRFPTLSLTTNFSRVPAETIADDMATGVLRGELTATKEPFRGLDFRDGSDFAKMIEIVLDVLETNLLQLGIKP